MMVSLVIAYIFGWWGHYVYEHNWGALKPTNLQSGSNKLGEDESHE